MDVAQMAAVVFAGGGIWDRNSDRLQREKFWEWWLTKAVPQAWDMDIVKRV
jgi:hypothetical protein